MLHLLGSTPSWERVWKAHEWATRIVPRFTERVVDPLVPTGPPMWSPDRHFDLAYHLRRVRLPEPGSMAQLLEVAQALGVTPLDRNRPPWVALFVEGLPDGKSAYVLQAHHVLMDGAGATQLFSRILPTTPDVVRDDLPAVAARPTVTPLGVALHGLAKQVRAISGAGGRLGQAAKVVQAEPAGSVRHAYLMIPVSNEYRTMPHITQAMK